MNVLNLDKILTEKELTNKWLAEKLGISPTSVSRYRTGLVNPRMEYRLKISEVLGVKEEELHLDANNYWENKLVKVTDKINRITESL